MTVIAAAIDKDGTVYMGCDNLCLQDGCVREVVSPKVQQNGDFLIGATGTIRMVQIAHYLFKPPKPKRRAEMMPFMVGEFVESLRATMKEKGGEEKGNEDNVDRMSGGLLIGYGGALYEIDSVYAVIDVALPYHAVGCARQEALSALYTARGANAESMVKQGLEAAAAFDINIRPPFTIKSLKKKR